MHPILQSLGGPGWSFISWPLQGDAAAAYWVEFSRYIHRNPVRAGLIDAPGDYPCSSYPAYVGQANTPDWLMASEVLAGVGSRDQRARYAIFMRGDCGAELRQFMEGRRRASFLGDEAFTRRVLEGREEEREIPELRRVRRVLLEDLQQAVCRAFDELRSTLMALTRGRGEQKALPA